MNIWIISKNGVPEPESFRALSEACSVAGVSYASASAGKRLWTIGDDAIRLTLSSVRKMKPRGNKHDLTDSQKRKIVPATKNLKTPND